MEDGRWRTEDGGQRAGEAWLAARLDQNNAQAQGTVKEDAVEKSLSETPTAPAK